MRARSLFTFFPPANTCVIDGTRKYFALRRELLRDPEAHDSLTTALLPRLRIFATAKRRGLAIEKELRIREKKDPSKDHRDTKTGR